MRVFSLSALVLLIVLSTLSFGQENVNHLLSYQGYLTVPSGDPVPDATYSIVFSIYDDLSAGTLLWTETHPSVVTENGTFSVYLGGTTPLPIDSLTRGDAYSPIPLYLEIQVGADPSISPRTRLGGTLYSAVSQRLEGDVFTKAGILVMIDPDGGDTTIASNASTGASMWRDYSDSRQVTIQGTGIDIGHIGGSVADDAGAAESWYMQGADAIELKSDADGARIVVTSSSGDNPAVKIESAELKFMGAADSSSFGRDKAELTDDQGNTLMATPTGVSAYDGSPSGYIGYWSAGRTYHYNSLTGDSVVFDLEGSGRAGWYGSDRFFENDHGDFESCHDHGESTSCIYWSSGRTIRACDFADFNETCVEISPTTTNLTHSDGIVTDTVLAFGSDPVLGGWWRAKSPDPGGSWSEWSAPRSLMRDESTGDSLLLTPAYTGLFSTTHNAEIRPSLIKLTSSDNVCSLHVTQDSISLTANNEVDSCGLDAFVTDFYPKLFMHGTGGYTVIVSTSGFEPNFSIGRHGTDPSALKSITYSYDHLGRILNTIRADIGEDGDSVVMSATGMRIFDGDLTLTNNNTGIEFYDGSSGLQTFVATTGGDIVASGSVTASSFAGDGSALGNLSASSLSSGTVAPSVGGTGLNTSATSSGSMLYTSATGTWSTLSPGAIGEVLTMGPGGEPNWEPPPTPGLSDARLKKNVSTIDGALHRVLSLRGVTYEWKKVNSAGKHLPESKHIGLIAQEVEKVIPEVVKTGTDGYKSVDYSKLVALLIEANKEQQKQIELQQDQINELTNLIQLIAKNLNMNEITLGMR